MKYGITIEYDVSVEANSDEEARKKAREQHKGTCYITGSWMLCPPCRPSTQSLQKVKLGE